MATGAASDLGRGEVRGFAVDIYSHVTSGVPNGDVGVGIGIIEETQGCILCLFFGLRLLGREFAKGDEHGGINGNGVIEECANYLLHEMNGLWGQQGGVVGVVGVLDFGAVGKGFRGMGGILWARRLKVLELV